MPVWGALAVAVPTLKHSEAVHFRVTMTFFVGSQPWEAQFSKRMRGWLTSLTEWQDAKKMVGWLNRHFVFFLGPPIMLIWKLYLLIAQLDIW